MEESVRTVQMYLAMEFPSLESRPDSGNQKKTKREFDYIATGFAIGGGHQLYVSDVLLADVSIRELEDLLPRFRVAEMLQEVGNQPVLVTPDGPRLLLEWIGPRKLTIEDVQSEAPTRGGVYVLAEPRSTGYWQPYFVGGHAQLRAQLELFVQEPEPGLVRGFYCAVVETGTYDRDRVVRDRVTTYLAGVCKVEDPVAADLPPLAVPLPIWLRV